MRKTMESSKPLTIRFEKSQISKANTLGIDIPAYLRQQLSEALNKKKCLYCGSKLASKPRNVPQKHEIEESDEDLL